MLATLEDRVKFALENLDDASGEWASICVALVAKQDQLEVLLDNIVKAHRVAVSTGNSSGAWSRHVLPEIYNAINILGKK